jgi:hypothetical protein
MRNFGKCRCTRRINRLPGKNCGVASQLLRARVRGEFLNCHGAGRSSTMSHSRLIAAIGSSGSGNGVAPKHLTFVCDCAPAAIALAVCAGKKMSIFVSAAQILVGLIHSQNPIRFTEGVESWWLSVEGLAADTTASTPRGPRSTTTARVFLFPD